MVRGYNLRRSHQFEHTRAIVYNILAVNRDPNKHFPTMEKLWPLPTDPDNTVDEKTEGQRLQEKLNLFKEGKLYNR